MINKLNQELLIGAGLVILLLAVINPLNLIMVNKMTMMLMAAILIVSLLFFSVIWQDQSKDEREALHKLIASRAAFLSGAAVLLIGMVAQTWQGHVDPWLPLALGVMVIAKLAVNRYNKLHR